MTTEIRVQAGSEGEAEEEVAGAEEALKVRIDILDFVPFISAKDSSQ